ncbi:MAG TPA: hypothetical protein PKG57_00285 [Flavobacteriales bacterium]|nr:hypothetical protein [Flavobacteriales bacterium]
MPSVSSPMHYTWRYPAAVFLVLAMTGPAVAQELDNRRERRIVLDRDTVRLDSMSIAPGSLTLWMDSVALDTAFYRNDPWHGLILRRPGAPIDTLIARYRVLPLLLPGPFHHKDIRLRTAAMADRTDPFKYVPGEGKEDPLGIHGLTKSGSISRGVLFGNNQDLSVNSALNLELSGKLTERIGVLASITDNNIPIQAGGNTAELQDFDRVFIKLFDERQELIAGDFVLERPKSHFLTYYKKSKGLGYSTLLGKDPLDTLSRKARGTFAVSAAISKGKFARNVIQGVEGVQGPYRLSATDGGAFIIVLSGTERVFINGQLMARGQENDYVIDYNTAELTFTARRLITKDRRITVEFQYSDKNYARSQVRFSNSWSIGRTDLYADLYTEQDHKNQPLQQTLSDADRLVLSQAGDDPLAAAAPGIDSTGWNPDEVLYLRRDSLGYFPVFVHSTDSVNARFRVSFSNVGPGNGDYVQEEFTPNGRVFKWVAPDIISGVIVRRGDHAPVRVLIPPRAQQVAEVGASHRFGDRVKVWGGVAWSNDDQNTFSSVDDGNDQGLAVRAGAEYAIPISRTDTALHLVVGTENEWVAKTFRQVDRFRPVEFERNWNALLIPQDNDQVLSELSLGLRAGKKGTARISTGLFRITDRYSGNRHVLESDLHLGKFDVLASGSVLSTSTRDVSSGFIRHKTQVRRRMKALTVGLLDEHEFNRFRNDSSGALLSGSYQFLDWEAFVQSTDTGRTAFRVSGGQRYEQALKGDKLARSTIATAYTASFALKKDPRRRTGLTFTYRQLRILDSLITPARPEDTWLARVEQDLTTLKGALTFNLFYELGSGLEQQREFIYVQVPAGQGTYIWIDYNGNGIKELNEFEVANFGYEADHIRAYTQTNRYVRVFSNQLSTSMNLRPGAVWAGNKGFKGFVAKWSDMASWRTDRKTGTGDIGSALNPFRQDPLDTTLTAFNASFRNTVYYDRSGRKWSIDHSRQSDRNKSLLLNGSETRTRDADILHLRVNATTRWTIELEAESGRNTSRSDLLGGRNWTIAQRAARPKLTWQPNTSIRMSAQGKYTEKHNDAEGGGEKAVISSMGLEMRWNTSGKGSVQVNGDLVDITYGGAVNSALGNEMLTGLKPGLNGTWALIIQRRLSDHLQLDLTYNGRHSLGVPITHVGGVQVRAYF